MIFQILTDFHLGESWRDMTWDEIEQFYDALRPGLRKATSKGGINGA